MTIAAVSSAVLKRNHLLYMKTSCVPVSRAKANDSAQTLLFLGRQFIYKTHFDDSTTNGPAIALKAARDLSNRRTGAHLLTQLRILLIRPFLIGTRIAFSLLRKGIWGLVPHTGR